MYKSFATLALLIFFSACAHVDPVIIPEAKDPFDPRPLMAQLKAAQKGPIDSMHFLVFGDSKLSPHFDTVLKRADSLSPQFCITTADLVKTGGGSTGFIEYKRLDKQAGWFLKKYPTWPSVGNHELSLRNKDPEEPGHDVDGYEHFADFFGMDEYKYSFQYGNATFIALDWPKIVKDTPDFTWLEATLKEAQGRHIFILKHRPYYTVGSKSTRDVEGEATDVTRLFSKYEVTAVFSGHDHIYYRTKRDGVYYVISAGAGAGIYQLKREKDAIEGDVYYGRNPEGVNKKYRFHNNDGTPDVTLDKAMYYVLSVHVKGEDVTFEMIESTTGKVWDTVIFTHTLK